ncbi:uncharacterized protein ALTATR162_LOCUS7331 [Alternaria atra]|uniref:Uncharacterized protein n=1 Tax=Alternaria atra TaxID=119953 RepID=A0A8J2I348_9PLEO|nr:uncharacterized protein ALTATR162_LOCUS7331 [Alternaria atra]CAG5171480.1 unnamed protein product [Alternaria atra]
MPSFNRFNSNLPFGKSKKDRKANSFPLRLTFTEQPQSDDYIIRSFDGLYSKTVRVWNGGDWNDKVMNGATGTLFESSHHVPGESAKSRKAFKDGKFGFCLEWIDFEYGGNVYRVRCMNEFSVKSPQCTDHPKAVFKDGPHRVYDLINWGETVTWGMIKDTEAEEVLLTDDQLKSRVLNELTDIEAKIDEAYQSGKDSRELENRHSALQRAISNKTYLLKDRSNAIDTSSEVPVSGSIYSSRKTVSNSAPGNAALDAKAKRNPNGKKKGKTGYIKDLTKGLHTVNE